MRERRGPLLAAAAIAAVAPGAALADPQLGPGRAAELEHLVRQDCGACHGLSLAGGLGPDLRRGAVSSTSSAETLASVILDGRPGTAMPPWRALLSEADAAWIAEYLIGEARR